MSSWRISIASTPPSGGASSLSNLGPSPFFLVLAPRPNYGITRIDQPSKRNFGYYVRIRVDGRKIEKYFADKASGGREIALQNARLYRDQIVAELPEPRRRAASASKRRIPQSGVEGVLHGVAKDRHGRPRYEFWQACWKNDEGRRRSAKFSIEKHGEEKALQLAIEARKSATAAESE